MFDGLRALFVPQIVRLVRRDGGDPSRDRGDRADLVRAVHGARPVRRGRVLHAGRRGIGGTARGLHHVAGGGAAVRRRHRPLPRRGVGAPRPSRPIHRGRGRCRPRNAGARDPRRTSRLPRCAPLRGGGDLGGAARSAPRGRSSRGPTCRRSRSTGSSWPTSCSTTCRSGSRCSTKAGARRSSTSIAPGGSWRCCRHRSTPLRAVSRRIRRSALEPRSSIAAAAFIDDASGLLRRGTLAVHRLRRAPHR